MKQMNIVIYQIGRLGPDFLKELDFQIADRTHRSSLSSFAIRDYYAENNHNPSVVLIYPLSLPLNPAFPQNQVFMSSVPQMFAENIVNVLNNPDEYVVKPYPLFASHPHSSEADEFLVVHSIGTYNTLLKQISFFCHYSDIFLEILFDMVDRYVKYRETGGDEPIRFVVDISSGLNIYILALLEAARHFGVWLQLANWHDKDKIPEIIIAFSDPILPNENIPYHIHFDTLKTKGLFVSPISPKDVENYSLAKTIYPDKDNKDLKNKLQTALEDFFITYSAIKNNTPLAIFQFGCTGKNTILGVLKDIIRSATQKLFQNYQSSPDLKKDDYLKIILALGFYYGISTLLEQYNIYKHSDSGTDIDTLRTSFKKIYKVLGLGLNDTILGNETDKLKKASQQKVHEQINGWKNLFCLLNSGKDEKKTHPQMRNFFAHAGFEQNITVYRIENGTLLLRYEDEEKNKIKNWLKASG